jgi:squalene synthase HpnC
MTTGFASDLARFGPERIAAPVSLAQARSYCSRLARSHYENFTVASLLLPRHLLPHFHNIYAYCRWADNLADEVGGGTQALSLLHWWREELLRCYQGRPRHPVMVALLETIGRFHIPKEPFLDLLFAFEQDQLVKRYQTFDQLLNYCRFSANPVGHLVLYVCESYDTGNASLADQICTALQLANFWQDVARDFDIGRVYLPGEDRRRFGYSDADLERRRFTPAFVELMRFQVERTRDFFYRGFPLLERVRPAIRLDIELFIQGGLAILRKIECRQYNVWQTRPVLSKWDKGVLLLAALAHRWLKSNSPRRHPERKEADKKRIV